MSYAPRIVLHAPPWDSVELADFVEDCIRYDVVLVCVVGPDCRRVEEVIDELVVGFGDDPSRFINTTSHPDEPLEEVLAFAQSYDLDVDPTSPVQELRLELTDFEYALALTRDHPERCWRCIQAACDAGLPDKALAVLSAGPLEDLLSAHGDQFIDRVELFARRHPTMRVLLSLVWRGAMTDEIWNRVTTLRKNLGITPL